MLPVNESKIEHRKLILLARMSTAFVKSELLPEIEVNNEKYAVDSCLRAEFQQNMFAQNSMYFHHSYAYADIPTGQEYDIVTRIERGKILPDSVRECKTKVLHFFSAFKTRLTAHANHGHHELSLIAFSGSIPDMIYELYEITERKPIDIGREICLCSYETLEACLRAPC